MPPKSSKSPENDIKRIRYDEIVSKINNLFLLKNEKSKYALNYKKYSKNVTQADILRYEENYKKYNEANPPALAPSKKSSKASNSQSMSKSTSGESMTSSQEDARREQMDVIGQEGVVSQIHTLTSTKKDEFMMLKLRAEKAQQKAQQKSTSPKLNVQKLNVKNMESFLMPNGEYFTDNDPISSYTRTMTTPAKELAKEFVQNLGLPKKSVNKVEKVIKDVQSIEIDQRFMEAIVDPAKKEAFRKEIESKKKIIDESFTEEELKALGGRSFNDIEKKGYFNAVNTAVGAGIAEPYKDPYYALSHNQTQIHAVDKDGKKDDIALEFHHDEETATAQETAGVLPVPTYAPPVAVAAPALPVNQAPPQGQAPSMIPKYIGPRTISTAITDKPTIGDRLDRSNPALSYGTSFISNGQVQINKSPEQVVQDSLTTMTGIAEKTPAGKEYLDEINKKMMALDAQIQMLKNMNNPPTGIKTQRLSDRKVYPHETTRTNDPNFNRDTDGRLRNELLVKPYINY